MSLEERLVQHIVSNYAGEAAAIVTQLPPVDGTALLGGLNQTDFAQLLEAMPAAKAAALLRGLAPAALGAQLASCDARTAAAVLRAMDAASAGGALAAMPVKRRTEVAALVSLPPNTVSLLMEPPPVLLNVSRTVQQARDKWSPNPRRHQEAALWVVDDERRLVGSVSTWALATAAPTDEVSGHLGPAPATLTADTMNEVAALDPLWEAHHTAAVLEQGRVVGMLRWCVLRRDEHRMQRRASASETAGALRGLYRVAAQSLLAGGTTRDDGAPI